MEIKFQCQVTGFKFKKSKLDDDGNTLEPPKIVLQLEAPIREVDVDALARMYEQEGECRLETWQMDLPLKMGKA